LPFMGPSAFALMVGRLSEISISMQIGEVACYCESDVLNTYRVWLIYELFRGSIATQELDWSERQIRGFIETRKTANPLLCEALGLPSMQ